MVVGLNLGIHTCEAGDLPLRYILSPKFEMEKLYLLYFQTVAELIRSKWTTVGLMSNLSDT